VIVLGDSITFGNSLALADTFSAQLQQRLVSQGRNVEILNFGVGGYDTLQEVSLLEIRGLKYRPSLVVLAYCLNDIGIASVSLEHLQRMQQMQNSRLSFLYESRLVQLISESVETIRTKNWEKHVNDPEIFRRDYANQIDPIGDDESELLDLMNRSPRWPSSTWYGDRDRVGRLRFGFRRLARLSKENDFRVVIMIIPLLQSKGGAYSHVAAHRIVEMEAHRAGFDTVDLTDQFLHAGMGNLTLTLGDITHPNKTGHRIMADTLSAFITDHPAPRPKP
jgi:lysophospholipase L1-like esterase